MREGGGNPLDLWFMDIPPKLRPWMKWITIITIAFGTATTVLWLVRGG